MKLLWLKAPKIGSKLIQWGLNSDCSHFGICFDEDEKGRGIAFHSYGTGTQLEWLRDFKKKYQVVHCLAPKEILSLEKEEEIYKAILDEEAGRVYDYPGLAYFAAVALKNKITGAIDLPTHNAWQKDNMRLCTGIAPTVFRVMQVPLPKNLYAEMAPPMQLFEFALKSGKFVESYL